MNRAILLIYGIVGVVVAVRAVVVWKRTHVVPVHRVRQGFVSAEWWARVLLVGGMGVAVAVVLLHLVGVVDAPEEHGVIGVLGAVVVALGATGIVVGQFGMRESWRIGVDPGDVTELVTGGPFRWVRNPIYTSMVLVVGGVAVNTRHVVALLATVAMVVGVELQVRRVEEPFLAARHGEAFARWASRAGRFLPLVGRLRSTDRKGHGAREGA